MDIFVGTCECEIASILNSGSSTMYRILTIKWGTSVLKNGWGICLLFHLIVHCLFYLFKALGCGEIIEFVEGTSQYNFVVSLSI